MMALSGSQKVDDTGMNDSADVEANLCLMKTAVENGNAFSEVFKNCGGKVADFLRRESYISVRGTGVCFSEQDLALDYSLDLDGIVIEWTKLTGTSQRISHLQIVPPGNVVLKYIYPVIKKHLELNKYSRVQLEVLKYCVASQLYYTDGWETWLGFVPDFHCTNRYLKEVVLQLSRRMLHELKAIFQVKMKNWRGKGMAEKTLHKNNLNDLSKVFILPDDQECVLNLFQSSIDDITMLLSGFKTILITFRFGEKCESIVDLPIGDNDAIRSISVHVGLNIGASYPSGDELLVPIDLMWCREGLQRIVGRRGNWISALSFSECANYQSNLDGKAIDVHRDLRAVCCYPDKLNFVQLYSDIPHRHPKCRMHPISAAIITAYGIVKNRASIDADARVYLSEADNNFENLTGCKCRLEFVFELPAVLKAVRACDLLDLKSVGYLLQKYPLLAPFRHLDFVPFLRAVGQYLVQDLSNLLDLFKGTGNSNAVWNAFQYELAIEKLLWGRPNCSISRRYSINLGPGVNYPSRCRTDAMGFLSLEPRTACCENEYTTPPLEIYTNSDCIQRQMVKCFGVSDLIGGSNTVLGRRLVMILLKDLYEIGRIKTTFDEFHLRLKSDTQTDTRSVVGGSTVKQVVELLLSARTAKFPMVIVNVFQSLQRKGVDVSLALECGVLELNLCYFPAVRLHDQQKNPGLYWQWNQGLWVLTDLSGYKNNDSAKASLLTPVVVRELENRQLCHTSTLQNTFLPWVTPCVAKLRCKKLSNEQLVSELTFVTCVALLMQGRFVDYNKLNRLERDMPINQRELQTMEIQSKFLLSNFHKFRLWRLHHSIPSKIHECASKSVEAITVIPLDTTPDPVLQLEPPHQIMEIDEDLTEELIEFAPTRHLPGNCKRKWSSAELSILGEIAVHFSKTRYREQYAIYQKECIANGIPDRPFHAFRVKMNLLKR